VPGTKRRKLARGNFPPTDSQSVLQVCPGLLLKDFLIHKFFSLKLTFHSFLWFNPEKKARQKSSPFQILELHFTGLIS
jgi:hypothetical protein